MRAFRISALLAVLSFPASALSPADFAGEWRGENGVHVEQQAYGNGFHVILTLPGDPPRIEAWLYPGGHDGMFAAEGSGNPLDGDVMVWGRLTDQSLILYRLALGASGKIQLDRFDRRAEPDGMTFHLERRQGPDETVSEGRLEMVP
ncbi:hypothetical protein [Marinivivus vitaminiproducens]|uniref:hypothetical protein n=1 Tax=Marinivivus vitaminiproducens TaxID=3035935 RepID=UPI0027A06720|nr:hypothetical protein P4R82_05095 [Geminicoccaceae bacterium SCSIO 64248]